MSSLEIFEAHGSFLGVDIYEALCYNDLGLRRLQIMALKTFGIYNDSNEGLGTVLANDEDEALEIFNAEDTTAKHVEASWAEEVDA